MHIYVYLYIYRFIHNTYTNMKIYTCTYISISTYVGTSDDTDDTPKSSAISYMFQPYSYLLRTIPLNSFSIYIHIHIFQSHVHIFLFIYTYIGTSGDTDDTPDDTDDTPTAKSSASSYLFQPYPYLLGTIVSGLFLF
jgi:hypothetical protein